MQLLSALLQLLQEITRLRLGRVLQAPELWELQLGGRLGLREIILLHMGRVRRLRQLSLRPWVRALSRQPRRQQHWVRAIKLLGPGVSRWEPTRLPLRRRRWQSAIPVW
jgi:hypothetical protein